MNGFITKLVSGTCLSAGLISLVGCTHYRDIVDPCWPQRYNSIAQHNTRDMLNAQSDKGHVLDQTVWNWHFEADPKTGAPTDRLNGAGIETLKLISRHMPSPDYLVYLQNAQDVPFVAGIAPDILVGQRSQLNERRIQAIQTFLTTQSAAHGGGAYHIAVHDFAPTGNPAYWTDKALEPLEKNLKTGTPQVFTAPKTI
jgi:hypothetical protein